MGKTYKGMHQGEEGQRSPLAFLAYDVMETNYGEWFTIAELAEQLRILRPDQDISYDTINRSVWRMLKRGVIEYRPPDPSTPHNNYHPGARQPAFFRVPTRDYWETHAPQETDHRNGAPVSRLRTTHLVSDHPADTDDNAAVA